MVTRPRLATLSWLCFSVSASLWDHGQENGLQQPQNSKERELLFSVSAKTWEQASFAQLCAVKGMGLAGWPSLGPIPTVLEEQGPRVGEDHLQKKMQIPFPEDGGRDGDQAETVVVQHPVHLEPELLSLGMSDRHIRNPNLSGNGWKVGIKTQFSRTLWRKAGYSDSKCPRRKSRKISQGPDLFSLQLPLARRHCLALLPSSRLPMQNPGYHLHLLLQSLH